MMKLFSKRNGITINISTEAVVRIIALVLAAFLFINFIDKIAHQLELFGVAAFLALALNPAVSGLSRRLHIKSRVVATGLAYVVVLTFLIGLMSLVVPPLVHQTDTFIHTIPTTVSNINNQHSTVGHLVQRYNLQSQVNTLSHDLKNRVSDAPHLVFRTAGKVGSVFVATLTIIVLTFMMLVEGPLWFERIYQIMPAERRSGFKELATKMYRVITGYVNGQVFIAALAALMSFLALTIASHFVHASVNPIAMSVIVFLFGLIPLIGNTIAAVIVVVICAFSSLPLAIIMAIYFPIYQQTENSTLQPHIQAKNNQLTPLLVFMSALIGAGFGGLLGAFVAIPAAGCLRILLEHHFGSALSLSAETVEKSKEPAR